MGTESRQAGVFSAANPREEALSTILYWETGKGNLDLVIHDSMKNVRKESRPFYLELVKGTVRNLLLLDYRLEKLLDRPLSSLPSAIKNILRLGAYQIDFMNVPKPVSVNLMVELSKKHGHPGTTRLVNSVLRKLASEPPAALPSDPAERLSILYSHPRWLVEKWMGRLGEKETEELLKWDNSLPSLDVRINRSRITHAGFLDICRRHGLTVSPTVLDEAFMLDPSGPVDKLPGYKEGFYWIQSISAQLPPLLLNPKPGEKIVDLCAAPGGKSCQIAEMIEDRGEVLAVDAHEERLKKVEENQRRLGFHSILTLLVDGREAGGLFPESADAVLLDAPCSATGSFRRKADARWSRAPDDFPRYSTLQSELLESASRIVRPGGRMVYATCSLEPEENREVVEQFMATHANFVVEEPHPPLPKSILEGRGRDGRFVEILPHRDKMDGFFMVELKKC